MCEWIINTWKFESITWSSSSVRRTRRRISMLAWASRDFSNFKSAYAGRLLPARVSMSRHADSSVEAWQSADLPKLTLIAEVESAIWRLRLNLEVEFELKVCVRFDFQSVSTMDEYPVAVLVEYSRGLDVRYGSVEVEIHQENIIDLQPWLCKIEVLRDVRFFYQPIFEGLDTDKRILFDFLRRTVRELFCRDFKQNEVVNLRLYAVTEVR